MIYVDELIAFLQTIPKNTIIKVLTFPRYCDHAEPVYEDLDLDEYTGNVELITWELLGTLEKSAMLFFGEIN